LRAQYRERVTVVIAQKGTIAVADSSRQCLIVAVEPQRDLALEEFSSRTRGHDASPRGDDRVTLERLT
jgi:hypothetical protein